LNAIIFTPAGAAPVLPSAADLDTVAAEAAAKQATAGAGAGPEEVLPVPVSTAVGSTAVQAPSGLSILAGDLERAAADLRSIAEAPAPAPVPAAAAAPVSESVITTLRAMAELIDSLAGDCNSLPFQQTVARRGRLWDLLNAFKSTQ
jgi:nucleoid-associated protein YgaU